MVRRTVMLGMAYVVPLLIMGVPIASASARGPVISVKRVEGTSVVQAKSVATISVQCPAQAPHPVGADFGALTAAGRGQVVLAASYPTGRKGWSVSVLNLSDQSQSFGAAAICLATSTRFAYPRTNVIVRPHQAWGAVAQCPRSAPTPISSLFELQPGVAPGSAIVNWMSQTYNKEGLTGKQNGGMLNLTGMRVGIRVGAVCSGLAITTQQASAVAPSAGTKGFTFTCPSGEQAIGGAFFGTSFPDSKAVALDELLRVSPRKWAVEVRNLATHPVRFTAGEVCAR